MTMTGTMTAQEVMEFEKGWILIEERLQQAMNLLELNGTQQGFSSLEHSVLYSIMYNLCHRFNTREQDDVRSLVYDRYKQLAEYIAKMVLTSMRGKHDEFLLREFVNRWENHKITMRFLSDFFKHLDRYFISKKNLPSITAVSHSSFHDQVYAEVKNKIKRVIIAWIDREREGKLIDRALLKKTLETFQEIGSMEAYDNDFESEMLADTAAYYSRKAASWIGENSFPEYMLKAEECLKRENERAEHYLHPTSEPKLLETSQHELLVRYANQLLNEDQSGCRALLRDQKIAELSRMYTLFCRIPNGLEPIAAIFRQQVSDEGESLIKQAAKDAAMNKKTETKVIQSCVEQVWKYMDLHDKYLHMIKGCFANDRLFFKALKEGFEFFCNKRGGTTTAELLAIFCDSLLNEEDSQKLGDGDKLEDAFEKAVTILSYVGDKDLFAEFYRNKLARRLLLSKKCVDDHEKSMLTKLKQMCGKQCTYKMEGMVTDLSVLRESQAAFEDYLRENRASNPGIKLSVRVFNTASWPSHRNPDLALPAEMVRCVEVFTDFYKTKKPKQKLSWMSSFGTCTLDSVDYAKLQIQLIMTPYQAAVLLLFDGDHANTLSYADIKRYLNLKDEDMVRVLHSLSCAKHKILNKTQPARKVTPSDSFSLNMGFSSNMRRIKIPLPPMDEKKTVVKSVDIDRSFAVDASIVRILKCRKVLSFQQLLLDCAAQLSPTFQPQPKMIKARINHLIELEFLERDKDNPQMFRYIA